MVETGFTEEEKSLRSDLSFQNIFYFEFYVDMLESEKSCKLKVVACFSDSHQQFKLFWLLD